MEHKFDRHAATYEQALEASVALSGESSEYFAAYKRACLERVLRPGSAILDYGCGVGTLTAELVGRFGEVHGYDPSPASLALAATRAPVAVLHHEPGSIPRARFDAVVVANVLHHVPPAERATLLTGLRERLVPGGQLVIFEHNPFNPLTRRAVAACPYDDDAVLLWPWEARGLLRGAGLGDVRLEYIVFFPRPLARLRWLEPRLGWCGLGAQMMVIGRV